MSMGNRDRVGDDIDSGQEQNEITSSEIHQRKKVSTVDWLRRVLGSSPPDTITSLRLSEAAERARLI